MAAAGPPQTVPAVLERLLRADGSRPLVTWVDLSSSARVELSVATVANWVAKTGGLLQDSLDVAAGDRVRLSFPSHWLAVTWALGCWTVGAVVETDETEGSEPPVLDVHGDDRGSRTTGRPVVVGLGPFGGPARRGGAGSGDLDAGAVDAGAEVLGHPDVLVVYDPPTATSPALASGARVLDQAATLAAAAELAGRLGLDAGARLLTAAVPTSVDGLLETVLAPLVAGGSVVLVAGSSSPAAAADLADRERADVVRVTA